jgi:phytoene dehydrogenase-like protein
MSAAPQVTVAGGGLAGMTAALRLAERGYDVKLFEEKPYLGGNLASRPQPGGVALDVYPHMFLSWYHNFWRMLEGAGVDRSQAFIPIDSVKQLRRDAYPRFTTLTDGYSPRHVVQNLFSGVGPPADMFVFWYATVDLLAERMNPTMVLDNMSVTGFMQARPYMTERAMKACDNFITMVWAIPAYQTCAEDYREYLAYSVSSYKPPCLLAKGPAAREVIAPLEASMQNAGVEIRHSVGIKNIACAGGRVVEITLEDAQNEWTEPVDELVVAVPPHTLSSLIRHGGAGDPVVAVEPQLAELARLRSQRIPIVHLFLKRKLKHIPKEPVGLYDSRLALAFTDISECWTGLLPANSTVLSVSASNPYGLPDTGADDDGFAIVEELAEYLDFEPGVAWGDSDDIDWDRTRYESNDDSQLFINETGIDIWRPGAQSGIPNLYFAGNFCRNRIGMMTVESAVASGLEAARALVKRRGLGTPVEIIEPSADNPMLSMWLRYAYGPSVMAAKAWSSGSDLMRSAWQALKPSEPPPPPPA